MSERPVWGPASRWAWFQAAPRAPLAVDELASEFPNLTIIAAHPGWPWVEEMTAVALHKGNVYLGAVRLGAEVLLLTA